MQIVYGKKYRRMYLLIKTFLLRSTVAYQVSVLLPLDFIFGGIWTEEKFKRYFIIWE